MLPDFALHHLPLYAVTLSAVVGLGFWGWVRFTLARQTEEERKDAIADRALAIASPSQALISLNELADDAPSPARSLGRQVR